MHGACVRGRKQRDYAAQAPCRLPSLRVKMHAAACVNARTVRAKVHAPCLRIFTFRALEGAQANLTEREYNTYRQPILDECMVMGSPCKDCLGRVGGGLGRLLVLREWGVRTAYAVHARCVHMCTQCVIGREGGVCSVHT